MHGYKHLNMKKILLLVGAILALSASCSDNREAPLEPGEFLIEGRLPANRYDSAVLYLVPMQGPQPRPVDSVFVNADGTFSFRGNVEQMAVLRLDYHYRFGIQELLVVTEPGHTKVILDSIRSAQGTPQNDALQEWKEHQEKVISAGVMLNKLRKQIGSDAEEFIAKCDSVREEAGEFNYQWLKSVGRKTVSIFINKIYSGKLDSIRRAELNELLIDTVDYSKPQPGFRK